VASGALDVEHLDRGSAVAAEQKLIAQRGIGVWTARYVMMRGGFADVALVGDSAVATALQRLHRLDSRPAHDQTAALLSAFAPHRSIATMHLWNSLKDNPGPPPPSVRSAGKGEVAIAGKAKPIKPAKAGGG
jgi:3-methyladenine DNA glycosylase/8-oxoguanine DNA glycosylase